MPANPLFNSNSSPNQSTNPGSGLNEASKKYTQGRNTFDYSRSHYFTARYADITPFEAIDCVEGDVIELGSKHEIRTHTLASSLQSDVFMKRTYAYVDMLAILPLNWHKIFMEPSFGDDIDASKANTFCRDFFSYFYSLCDNASSVFGLTPESSNLSILLNHYLHYLMMFESVFSNGSLLSYLGYHASSKIYFSGGSRYLGMSFDKSFELLFSTLSVKKYQVVYDNGSEDVSADVSIRELLNIIRYYHVWEVDFDPDATEQDMESVIQDFNLFFQNMRFRMATDVNTPLNYSRLAAYQIVCCNFFTRDTVDDIITAKLYRESMQGCITRMSKSGQLNSLIVYNPDFVWNGNYYRYDSLSGYNLDYVLKGLSDFPVSYSSFNWVDSDQGPLDLYIYFMNLFGYQRSLRYADYFTGGRKTPLAIGDVTAEVTENGVNAIDMTVALLRARFGNQVSRVGRRPDEYIRDVVDGTPPPEADEPRLLASVTSSVRGFEVENTSENQGDIVTILRSSDSNNVYSFSVGQPAIVIGLLTFDVQRVYSRTGERFFYNEDRYDMFNKFMQYSGDQKILMSERDTAADSGLDGPAFAYALRDMHYKQRYPIANGGFIDFMPSHLFVTDNDETGSPDVGFELVISQDYVRSRNGEFDRFYKSLTNYSLAGYYHFFISFKNICIAHRKMDYKPSIL